MRVIELDGKQVVTTDTKWESLVGYSRAVKRGNQIMVTGTVGVNEDGTFPKTTIEQARRSLDIIVSALEMLGGNRNDVVRTVIYLTKIDDWEDVGKVHAEYFSESRPATTIVEVSRLVPLNAWVEIEVDAVLV